MSYTVVQANRSIKKPLYVVAGPNPDDPRQVVYYGKPLPYDAAIKAAHEKAKAAAAARKAETKTAASRLRNETLLKISPKKLVAQLETEEAERRRTGSVFDEQEEKLLRLYRDVAAASAAELVAHAAEADANRLADQAAILDALAAVANAKRGEVITPGEASKVMHGAKKAKAAAKESHDAEASSSKGVADIRHLYPEPTPPPPTPRAALAPLPKTPKAPPTPPRAPSPSTSAEDAKLLAEVSEFTRNARRKRTDLLTHHAYADIVVGETNPGNQPDATAEEIAKLAEQKANLAVLAKDLAEAEALHKAAIDAENAVRRAQGLPENLTGSGLGFRVAKAAPKKKRGGCGY